MSAEVDSSWHNVYVHQVVHNPGLDMTLMLVNKNLSTTVEYLHKAIIRLHCFIQWLILCLVVLNSLSKIFHYLLLKTGNRFEN